MSEDLLPLFARARRHAGRTAIHDAGRAHTYAELLEAAERVAGALLAGRADLGGERVAFLVPPSFEWVAVQWGTWRAGGVAVPLALAHPPPELAYTLDDAGATIAVAAPTHAEALRPLAEERGLRFVTTDAALEGSPTARPPAARPPAARPELTAERPAMVLYTSGTTGRPKGAVLTHGNLQAQVESLVEAWAWQADDRILEILPLHHLHGIVNIVTCALWSGAQLEILPRFDAGETWRRLAAGRTTLLMAVPTIYSRLISAWEEAPSDTRRAWSAAARRLRLMVSGSAALPVPVLERWRKITGHTLLERYGMTEIGMALSNPLDGERRPGAVGAALPGVEVRLVDESGHEVAEGQSGELEVRGPTVFAGYLGRPEATAEAFRDGWFRTGDVAIREAGVFRLLGRSSVDILKTGGEKVSALEIEATLLEHPSIRECAVVGVPHPEWGQEVSAALVTAPGETLDLEAVRAWAGQRLAAYKVPRRTLVVEALPRNALGKVVKPEVAKLF